jgi:hypothetical protein
MTTTGDIMSEPWRRAHETARTLHDALAALGIPETELGTLTARGGQDSHLRVHIPPLTVESAGLLLTALGPALGPGVVGYRGEHHQAARS